MAIYHLEAKVVSRGAGRSAVAASAYLSCTNILNDYDGVRHDFTRKKGLVWQDVFLPEFAPAEWKDRGLLWNAVEKNEKTKDSRLAREFVPALPIELTPAQWQELLTDFIQNNFVAEGMCADVAIHDPHSPGHNPHAHIMLTVRPLNEDGTWQHKTEKEYLCVRKGEERGFSLEIQAFPPFVFFSVSTGMIRAALSYVDSSANSQRTVTRLPPPMVQVNRVRSQSPLVISSIAVGIKVSSSTTS